MKKTVAVVLCLGLVLSLCACNNPEPKKIYEGTAKGDPNKIAEDVVDLRGLSSTVIYGTVNDIMISPNSYIGKTIIMEGQCALSYNQADETKTYYSCVITHATGCCPQGIEFMLKGDTDYPELNTDITVQGVYAAYEEDGYTYYRLKDAVLL